MAQTNVNTLLNRTNQIVSQVGSMKFLDELNGQLGQIQEQIGYIEGQKQWAQQTINPGQYKKAKARAEAQTELIFSLS